MEIGSQNFLTWPSTEGFLFPLSPPLRAPKASAHRLSILVGDDEQTSRELLGKLCDGLEARFEFATSGRQVLERLDESKFDLLLLDRSLGDVDGLEVLSQLRSRHNPVELPVVMVTASNDRQSIIQAFERGANDYLTKPLDMGVSQARIAIQLQLKTLQRQLAESQERYALAVMGTNDGLWDWNLETSVVYYSPRWQAMIGFPATEFWGAPDHWFSRIHPEDRPQVEELLTAHLGGASEHFETELRLQHRNGDFRWMLCRGQAAADPSGKKTRIVGALTDITKGKVVDPLTGLANRTFFLERLARRLERYDRDPSSLFVVMYIDLDNFKQVNDNYGHAPGDQLLISIARTLESVVRRADSVISRLGGDEFALLIEQVDSLHSAQVIAERVSHVVATPLLLEGRHQVRPSASIGVVVPDAPGTTADDLLRRADIAMYYSKEGGKGDFRVYQSAMEAAQSERFALEQSLREGIASLRLASSKPPFELYFQPICDLATGHVEALDCQVNWLHPQQGPIAASRFLPLAEGMGLAGELGQWYREEACAQLRRWQVAGRMSEVRLFLQVHPDELLQPDLPNSLAYALSMAQLDPRDVVLHVAEQSLTRNPTTGAVALENLRRMGVGIALGEFGIGPTTLAQLQHLQADYLKLSPSFVSPLTTCGKHCTLVEAVATLAKGLAINVVAEGVADHRQSQLLLERGCRWGQGSLFAGPMSAPEMTEYLARQGE